MAAPKGNKFAKGHGWGRPAKYDKPQDLSEAIDAYFKSVTKYGKCRATISGLAVYLGFESKQSLYDYQDKKVKDHKVFSYLIKQARSFIEACHESNLYSQGASGSIFALKNMGWKDTSESEVKMSVMKAEVKILPSIAKIATSEKDVE